MNQKWLTRSGTPNMLLTWSLVDRREFDPNRYEAFDLVRYDAV
jgi:hypothetical protein